MTIEFVPTKELDALKLLAKEYYTEQQRISEKYLMPVLETAWSNGDIDTLEQLVEFTGAPASDRYQIFGYVCFEAIRAVRRIEKAREASDDK